MSTQEIALGINLRKNMSNIASANGKYFSEVYVQKTLSLQGRSPYQNTVAR